MGLSDMPVALVLFESQTEWEFRTCLPQLMQKYMTLLVYPVTSVDRKNLYRLGGSSTDRIKIVEDLSAEAAADEIVTFRYNEEIMRGRRLSVTVYDITNRWLSKELAQ